MKKYIIWFLCGFVIGCTPKVAGTISETETTCVIEGTINYPNGTGVSYADVLLHKQGVIKDLVLYKATASSLNSAVQTDKNGHYRFDSVAVGSYLVEINDRNSRAALFKAQVSDTDTLIVVNGDLGLFGAMTGKIDSTILVEMGNAVPYIAEIGRRVTIDSSGYFTVDKLPAYNAYTICFVKGDSIVSSVTDTISIPVSSGDTTRVIDFGSKTGIAKITGLIIENTASSITFGNKKYATVTVSATGMVSINNDLTMLDSMISGTISSIPAGTNRLFEVKLFDSLNNLLSQSSSTANVVAGDTIKLTFVMKQTPDPGLVAFWSFDTLNTGFFVDDADHGYNVASSGLSLIPGIRGYALNAPSSTFELVVSNSTVTFNLSSFSISCWYYSNINPLVMTEQGQYIFDFQYPASGVYNGYGVFVNTEGKVEFSMSSMNGNSWYETYSNTVFKAQTWYYIVATYDGIESKVYVNGVCENTLQHPGGYVDPLFEARIGCQRLQDGTLRCFANGRIDELKVLNYALDSTKVAGMYSRDR